jgi:hypothetical protein
MTMLKVLGAVPPLPHTPLFRCDTFNNDKWSVFCRWRMTLRMTGFLDFVYRPEF